MSKIQTLSASLEDYLEAIFHIITQKKVARVKDISHRLKVNNSSVTGALKVLTEKNLINYAPYDVVTLTPAGETVAREVISKHEVLKKFFVKVLSVDEEAAEDSACKMEHSVSEEILERLVQFVEFINSCPRGGPQWIEHFREHCNRSATREECVECLNNCLEELKT